MKSTPKLISVREIIYGLFYLITFALAVISGIIDGFRGDSHNGPAPYLIEFFVLPVSLVIWLIDYLMRNTTRVHKIGFSANLLVMVYVVVIALIFS